MSITDFCKGYVPLATDIAGLAKYFLIASLVVAIAAAAIELWGKLQPPPVGGPVARVAGGAAGLKEMVGAIKDLIAAVAAAPLWLALFAVGIAVFWVPGSAVGEACTPTAGQQRGTGGGAGTGSGVKTPADRGGAGQQENTTGNRL